MTCIKTYHGKCVIYSGPSIPEFGIYQGKTTMDELVGILLKLSQQEREVLSPPDVPTPQVRAAAIPNVGYGYGYDERGFHYDLKEILQNLPEGYKVAHKQVGLYADGMPLATSRSSEAILNVDTLDLPARVKVDMTVHAEESILHYQDRFTLFPATGTYRRSLSYVDDTPSLPDDPQMFRKTVSAELQLIKRELFDRTSSTPVTSAELSAFREELQNLKRELAK